MTLRIIGASGPPYQFVQSTEPDEIYGPLADSVRRISQKLHFESAPGLSALNGSLFNSTEDLQNDLLTEVQALLRAQKLFSLLEELYILEISGLKSAFENSLYALPGKAKEIYQEPGVTSLFDELPQEVAALIPATAEDLPLALDQSSDNVRALETAVLIRQRALTSRMVERENHAAIVSSSKAMAELVKIWGAANE